MLFVYKYVCQSISNLLVLFGDFCLADVQTIFQNGGFTKVWFSLKTVLFPLTLSALVWFWRRIMQLSRSANLLERWGLCCETGGLCETSSIDSFIGCSDHCWGSVLDCLVMMHTPVPDVLALCKWPPYQTVHDGSTCGALAVYAIYSD